MIQLFLLSFIWFAYWSAESGASLPWSKKWQDKKEWFSELPEIIIALSIASIAAWGWGGVFLLAPQYTVSIFMLSLIVSYFGKQSGTWAYLNWESHKPRNPDRQSTLRPINDAVAKKMGYKLGDEGYAWIWAATKGFIMTLPIGGLGVVFHPLGHEIGSHAKGRLKGDPNMWKELVGGGVCYSASASLFIWGCLWLMQ